MGPLDRRTTLSFFNKILKSKELHPGDYKHLVKMDGLGEWRWTSSKKEWRLIGFYAKDDIWVAAIGCTHKGDNYDPWDAKKTAQSRKKEIERGLAMTIDWEEEEDE